MEIDLMIAELETLNSTVSDLVYSNEVVINQLDNLITYNMWLLWLVLFIFLWKEIKIYD